MTQSAECSYVLLKYYVRVLKQMDGEEVVYTLFYSFGLNAAQRNYSTYERELLAVVKASDAFRVFLL